MLVLRNLLVKPELLLPDSFLLSSILVSFFFAWHLPSSSSCLPSLEPFFRTLEHIGGTDDDLSVSAACGSPRSASFFTNNINFSFQVCTAPPLALALAPPWPWWWTPCPARWSTTSHWGIKTILVEIQLECSVVRVRKSIYIDTNTLCYSCKFFI